MFNVNMILIVMNTYLYHDYLLNFDVILPIFLPIISPKEFIICIITSPWPKAKGIEQNTKIKATNLNSIWFYSGEGMSS